MPGNAPPNVVGLPVRTSIASSATSAGKRRGENREKLWRSAALKAFGVDFALVPPRYRSTYFSHTFSGGYSAGYYSYIWSEVLDAVTVDWIKEHGGLTRANGDRFRAMLLSRGGSEDSLGLFRKFSGGEPMIGPLLKRRGLE